MLLSIPGTVRWGGERGRGDSPSTRAETVPTRPPDSRGRFFESRSAAGPRRNLIVFVCSQGNEVSSLGELLQSEISSELDNALDGGAIGQDGGERSGDDDIFKQLSDSSALLEQFFDFVSCDIKVHNTQYTCTTVRARPGTVSGSRVDRIRFWLQDSKSVKIRTPAARTWRFIENRILFTRVIVAFETRTGCSLFFSRIFVRPYAENCVKKKKMRTRFSRYMLMCTVRIIVKLDICTARKPSLCYFRIFITRSLSILRHFCEVPILSDTRTTMLFCLPIHYSLFEDYT